MFKDNWLTRQWNAHKEKKRIATHHKEQCAAILGAIHNDDVTQMSDILAATEVFDQFVKRNFLTLFDESIKTDNLNAFKALLDLNEHVSVNFKFSSYWDMMDIGHGRSETPILVKAITLKSEKVASYLANHPDLDANAVSYSHSALCEDGGMKETEEYGELPSVLAEENGLADIRSVLLKREAEALMQQAQQKLKQSML